MTAKKKQYLLLVAAFILLLGNFFEGAFAQSSHGIHRHGFGELNIALDSNNTAVTLAVELRLPLSDLVGFEHFPETKEEKTRLKAIEQSFKDHKVAFSFPNLEKCRFLTSKVEVPQHTSLADHEHEHESKEEHNDLVASYDFDCSDVKGKLALVFTLFKRYPSVTDLVGQLVSGGNQSKVSLNPGRTQVLIDLPL